MITSRYVFILAGLSVGFAAARLESSREIWRDHQQIQEASVAMETLAAADAELKSADARLKKSNEGLQKAADEVSLENSRLMRATEQLLDVHKRLKQACGLEGAQ